MAAHTQVSPLAGTTVNGSSAPGGALAIITLHIFEVTARFILDAWRDEPMKGAASASRKIRQKSAAKNVSLLNGKPVVARCMGAAA